MKSGESSKRGQWKFHFGIERNLLSAKAEAALNIVITDCHNSVKKKMNQMSGNQSRPNYSLKTNTPILAEKAMEQVEVFISQFSKDSFPLSFSVGIWVLENARFEACFFPFRKEILVEIPPEHPLTVYKTSFGEFTRFELLVDSLCHEVGHLLLSKEKFQSPTRKLGWPEGWFQISELQVLNLTRRFTRFSKLLAEELASILSKKDEAFWREWAALEELSVSELKRQVQECLFHNAEKKKRKR